MPSPNSILDNWIPELQAYRKSGKTPTEIARVMRENHGVSTSHQSVIRAFRRVDFAVHVPNFETDADYPERAKSEVRDKTIVEQWGMGMAKLVEPASFGDDSEIVVLLSDIHVPFHDVSVTKSAIELIKTVNPHRVVLNGDIADFFQLSRFNVRRERLDDLQWEIDMANEIRQQIREAVPNAVIDETEGNHDNRIRSYLESNAGALRSLRALEPDNLFKYTELDINWHPGCGFLLRREFLVKHGTRLANEAGATAKAELAAAGISGISGHTHRLGTYRKAGYVQRQWTEQGGLFRMDPDYIAGGVPNWQQGCVIMEISNKTDNFAVHEIPVVDGALAYGALLRKVTV